MKRKKTIPLLSVAVALLLLTACASRRYDGADMTKAMVVKDKAFRHYLSERGYAVYVGGALTGRRMMAPTAVGRQIRTLNCYRQGIHSLEGIAMFGQLDELVCSENPIEWLDLSSLPHLKSLTAMEVPLHYIDVSRCPALETLELSESMIDSIDVSHNGELRSLMCIFNPKITTIDLSGNDKLNTLYIRATSIRVLDLSHNASMSRVHATDTPVDTVWLSPLQDVGNLEVWVDDTIAILKR